MSKDDFPEKIYNRIFSGEDITPADARFFADHPSFLERPVPVRHFIESDIYLACPDVWPEIRNILAELFKGAEHGDRFSPYREFVFDAGIGSGKSFVVSCIFTYITYWLLCLEDPQKHFGLAPRSVICIMNTSTSSKQAHKVVFDQVKARIDLSPWFMKRFPPDKDIRSELQFPKNIVIFPGSSSETGPIGYNIIAAVVDEASWFVETDIKESAAEVFDVLDRRIDSRFGAFGMMAVTSSPRYIDDFTEKKYEESRRGGVILGYKRATWETRPDDIAMIKRGEYFEMPHPGTKEVVRVPKKYERAFKKNPSKAWRDFGAFASLALEPFFSHEEIGMLERAMQPERPAVGRDGSIDDSFKPVPGVIYFIHIDLGLSRDACGVGMAHAQSADEVEVDLILRIVCERRALELVEKGEPVDVILGRDQVDLDAVLDIVRGLSGRGFFIGMVTFDNFQSVHSRQILEREGFASDLLSVDKDTSAYDTLKTVARSGTFKCFGHAWFLHECKRLELIKGKKVDHPPNGTKDCADGVAGAVKSAMLQFDEEAQEEETSVDNDVRVDIDPQF